MTIEIPDNLIELAAEGANFIVTPESEEALLKLKKAEDDIEMALKIMKDAIRQKAYDLDPNLKSIKGNKLTLSIQEYGAKYAVDESQLGNIDKTLYEHKIVYSVDSKAVEKYIKEKVLDGLPVGITKPERNQTIKLLVKKGD